MLTHRIRCIGCLHLSLAQSARSSPKRIHPSNMMHVLFNPMHCSLAMPDIIACCEPLVPSCFTRTFALNSSGSIRILLDVKQTSALLGAVHHKDIAWIKSLAMPFSCIREVLLKESSTPNSPQQTCHCQSQLASSDLFRRIRNAGCQCWFNAVQEISGSSHQCCCDSRPKRQWAAQAPSASPHAC